jgi:hypothetical protein
MAPRRVSIAEANSGGRNKKNLSIQGGYEKSTNGQADVLAFGPIVELASGKLLVTLNPLFTGQDWLPFGCGYGSHLSLPGGINLRGGGDCS